jgi:Velvet factor
MDVILTRPFTLSDYELIVRQEPKQARMCGVGSKQPSNSIVVFALRKMSLLR